MSGDAAVNEPPNN